MAVHELTATAAGSAPSAETGADAGLVVRSVEVSYGNVIALRGVSARVPPGEFVSVLGANGAGKTTLVRAVTGLLGLHRGRVLAGSITLDGRSLVGLSSRDIVLAGIAHVPEGRMLFPRLTVEENLLCGAATRKDRGEIKANVDRVFTLFPRLAERRRQTAGYLSGGEQQMVAVGRALMAQPRYLLCDELSLGLAPLVVSQLFDLLSEVSADGVGVMVIEQNARLALQHTRHGYVIELGRVVLDGPCDELMNDTLVQDLYLGGGEATADFAAAAQRLREVAAVTDTLAEPVDTAVGDEILEVRDLTVRFEGLLALDSVSFGVNRGELFALIGPNGAGKTTLVNAITSVYRARPGATVDYRPGNGQPVSLLKMRPYQVARRGVGRTFQNLGSIPKLSVLENLLLGRFSHQRTGIFGGGVFSPRMRREGVAGREVVESIIELLHLARYRREPVGALPYGVQKRVELGRVLAMEPELLMLDEPMAGMSVDEKRDMVGFIFDIRAALGTTVLLIEHDMGVVMAIAERVMVLDNGKRIALGSPAEVQQDEKVIAAYLGST